MIPYSFNNLHNREKGGALDKKLRPLDIVFADRLVQHDMDTSPLGDPVGLISNINRVYFETDTRALTLLESAAAELDTVLIYI